MVWMMTSSSFPVAQYHSRGFTSWPLHSPPPSCPLPRCQSARVLIPSGGSRFTQDRSQGHHCVDIPHATAVLSLPRRLWSRFQFFIRSLPLYGARPPLLVVGFHHKFLHPELFIVGSPHGTDLAVSSSSCVSVASRPPPGSDVHARPVLWASLLGRSTRHLPTAPIGTCQVLLVY